MKLKIKDEEISNRLEAIRVRLGAKPVIFATRPLAKRVDVELSAEEVKDLFDASGLLIKNGHPVFVYIRDNHFANYLDDPRELKKIHFAVCGTLLQMRKEGRWDRYQVTNRDDDKYEIDTRRRTVEARLFPCQNCLNQVGYRCFSYATTPREQREEIIESFNAKEALDLLRQQFDVFKTQVSSLRKATLPAGYAPNHAKISRAYRASQNYTCENKRCGVNLNRARHCTDLHHADSVKNNNKYDNLRCLCKLCHADEHPHYRVSDECRRIIERARREQGINL